MRLRMRIRTVFGQELAQATSFADVERGWIQSLTLPGVEDGILEEFRRLPEHAKHLVPFLVFEVELVDEERD